MEEKIKWLEALAVIIIFVVYIACLILNDRIKAALKLNRSYRDQIEVQGNNIGGEPPEHTAYIRVDMGVTNTTQHEGNR